MNIAIKKSSFTFHFTPNRLYKKANLVFYQVLGSTASILLTQAGTVTFYRMKNLSTGWRRSPMSWGTSLPTSNNLG